MAIIKLTTEKTEIKDEQGKITDVRSEGEVLDEIILKINELIDVLETKVSK